MFSIIAAVGKNRELGNKGELVFHIKEDMRFFRDTTMGHTVVMGRKTWESLPRKLPGRKNVVVSSREITDADEVVRDLARYIRENGETKEEIFIIGGAMIYEEFLPNAKYLYLTEVDAETEADTYFPEFDSKKYRRTVLREGYDSDIKYKFVKYEKIEGK